MPTKSKQVNTELEAHPYAALFPPMPQEEFLGLRASIKEDGLLNPIVTYTHEGKTTVLDGIHRLKACQQADVKPEFTEYTGDNPFRFVFNCNIKRRQLAPAQRAVMAADLANIKANGGRKIETIDGKPATTVKEAAKLLNISNVSISRIKKIKRLQPDLIVPLREGSMTIADAIKFTEEAQQKKEKIAELQKHGLIEEAEKLDCGVIGLEIADKKLTKHLAELAAEKAELDRQEIVDEAKEDAPEGFYTEEEEEFETEEEGVEADEEVKQAVGHAKDIAQLEAATKAVYECYHIFPSDSAERKSLAESHSILSDLVDELKNE